MHKHLVAWSVAAAAALGASVAANAAPLVEVKFTDSEHYVDIGWSTLEGERSLATLRRHFERLGARYLGENDKLAVEVLAVDLAGRVDLRNGREIRTLHGTSDWPSIALRWTLQSPGHEPQTGEDKLADLNYQWNRQRLAPGEDLGYERLLIEDWYKKRFAAPQPQ